MYSHLSSLLNAAVCVTHCVFAESAAGPTVSSAVSIPFAPSRKDWPGSYAILEARPGENASLVIRVTLANALTGGHVGRESAIQNDSDSAYCL